MKGAKGNDRDLVVYKITISDLRNKVGVWTLKLYKGNIFLRKINLK